MLSVLPAAASDLPPTTHQPVLVSAASSYSCDADQRGGPIVKIGKNSRIAQKHVVGARLVGVAGSGSGRTSSP
jgi:hypothetical protein